ncbi:hypothetical protein P378_17345 [Desulforamulus profundi]|uniref:Uncharacterized protein n=1 Tax=Desulforamulus profundi TaxID=1383067 RepID=A0A2C6LGL0_9FIRM|nr:hypothetical protein [Desulforamulus profundi]MCL5780581.1 hypothetical protein [Bacillota bacterium]PHJ37260.1 hypothetical protein P378_17345 [Desulforamulus profundi]
MAERFLQRAGTVEAGKSRPNTGVPERQGESLFIRSVNPANNEGGL